MATSDVTICNLTLSMLGDVGAISSLVQAGSDPARRVGLHYPFAKATALARRDWGFARRYTTPAVVGTQDTTPAVPVAHWAYAYAYPTKCEAVRYVVPPTYVPSAPDPNLRVPFEIGHWVASDTEERTVIYTNMETALVAYTYDVDEAFMQAPFVDYLSAELAMRLVVPIAKAKPAIARSVTEMLQRAWGIALTHDSGQQMQRTDEFVPAIVRERA